MQINISVLEDKKEKEICYWAMAGQSYNIIEKNVLEKAF